MRLAFATFALLVSITNAHAQPTKPLPDIGQVATGHVSLLGKRIALPEGVWRVVSSSLGQIADATSDSPASAIGGVLLSREAGDGQSAFLLIHTNALPAQKGWGPPTECADETMLAVSVAEPHDLHNACTFVTASRGPRRIGQKLPAIGNADIARVLPSWALIAGFRVSDRRDFIDLRLGISPAAPAPGGWFAETTPLDGKRRKIVETLASWAQTARTDAMLAMRGPTAPILAFPDLFNPTAKSAKPSEDISTMLLGLYKLATYRLINSSTTWIIATILAGNAATGSWITLWQGLTHSAVFLVNEYAWEWQPSMPPVSFMRQTPPADVIPAKTVLAPDGMTVPDGMTTLVGGKQAPLPGTGWIELARASDDRTEAVALGKIDGATLQALAIVRANTAATTDIIGGAPDCGRGNTRFAIVQVDTPRDGYCVYGKTIAPAPAMPDDPVWAKTLERLGRDGVALPETLFTVGARVRTRENFVDLRYYFPKQANERDNLQAWASLLREPAELGLRSRLPAAGIGLPFPGADASRGEPAPGTPEWSVWKHSVAKVVTYRIASTIDTITVSYIITGSAFQTFAFAAVNAVVKPVLAYANEIGWAGYGAGRPKAALLSAEFPEIGQDRS
jgi:uncharacterized membrane protein